MTPTDWERRLERGLDTTIYVAIYARYSSDLQSPASIADQIRKCRQYAEARGWIVLDQHIYEEPALSATTMTARPALDRLLRAAKSKPCPFNVLLVDDTSRLTRDTADALKIAKDLKFADIRLIAVAQGIDSDNEQAQVLLTVHGLVDALYVQELAKKTHRGMEGKALRGFCTGGSTYGYRNVQTPEGYRKEINEAEAAIVRHIFELAAAGHSLDGIVRKLNAEGIAPPRPRDKRMAAWHPHGVREMLRNTTYIGNLIWNRQKFIRTPAGKRVSRPRPESEWIRVERPELRIIDDSLWQRVQHQLQGKRERYGRGGGRYSNLYGQGRGAEHLLTGFLRCGVCGGSLTIVSNYGAGRNPRYGCANQVHRRACVNDLRESESAIQERLFGRLQTMVLTHEIVEFAIEELEEELKTRLSSVAAHLDADRKREAGLQRELKKLTAFILNAREGDDLEPIRDEINERNRELKLIRDRLLTAGRDSVEFNIADLRAYVTKSLGDIVGLMKQDTAVAKAWLREHVESISMTPAGEGKNRYYVASGGWNLLGGKECEIPVIAGGGFEPPTFGL